MSIQSTPLSLDRVEHGRGDRGRGGDRARLAHALDASELTGDGVSVRSVLKDGSSAAVGSA